MATRVVWTETALNHLKEIREYIQQDNPPAATAFARAVDAQLDKLPNFPHLGRVAPKTKEAFFRELIFRSYRLIYFVDLASGSSSIYVVRIWHSARGEPDLGRAV